MARQGWSRDGVGREQGYDRASSGETSESDEATGKDWLRRLASNRVVRPAERAPIAAGHHCGTPVGYPAIIDANPTLKRPYYMKARTEFIRTKIARDYIRAKTTVRAVNTP